MDSAVAYSATGDRSRRPAPKTDGINGSRRPARRARHSRRPRACEHFREFEASPRRITGQRRRKSLAWQLPLGARARHGGGCSISRPPRAIAAAANVANTASGAKRRVKLDTARGCSSRSCARSPRHRARSRARCCVSRGRREHAADFDNGRSRSRYATVAVAAPGGIKTCRPPRASARQPGAPRLLDRGLPQAAARGRSRPARALGSRCLTSGRARSPSGGAWLACTALGTRHLNQRSILQLEAPRRAPRSATRTETAAPLRVTTAARDVRDGALSLRPSPHDAGIEASAGVMAIARRRVSARGPPGPRAGRRRRSPALHLSGLDRAAPEKTAQPELTDRSFTPGARTVPRNS